MIYKLELQNQIEEICWYPTMFDAVDDLVYRNEAAGRKVIVKERKSNSAQFSLTYPELDRTVDGTICRYGQGGRLPIDPTDILDDVEKMLFNGVRRREICRILSISTSTYLNAKRIVEIRKKTQNWRKGIE